jgi:hypothetical protein
MRVRRSQYKRRLDFQLSGFMGAPTVPRDTLLPTATAYEVASHFVRNGEHMLPVTSAGRPCLRPRRITPATRGCSFNLSETAAVTIPIKHQRQDIGRGAIHHDLRKNAVRSLADEPVGRTGVVHDRRMEQNVLGDAAAVERERSRRELERRRSAHRAPLLTSFASICR